MMAGIQSAANANATATTSNAEHSELNGSHPDQDTTATYAKPC